MVGRNGVKRKSSRILFVERRAFVRYGSEAEVFCRPSGAMRDAGWVAKVHNISLTGIGLLLRHRFQPGTALVVELQSASGSERCTLPARVVHATPVRLRDHPYWLIGCEFYRELADHELEAFR
jgi:hypothetical protein